MRLENIRTKLETKGEIVAVLDSGAEYELHKHDTTFENGNVVTEGMLDGEYRHISFDPESVEHVYWHKES